MDAIEISLLISRMDGICAEMGEHLKHSAFSTNIRDRSDYSCAVFDARGQLLAQSADIPVHLGSMAYAMSSIIAQFEWSQGDTMVFNDPDAGGTHLPDVTLLSPFFHQDKLHGFVANRAHHADIGASDPGSMPLSSRLEQEGILIPPSYLVREGVLDETLLHSFTAQSRNPADEYGDYMAQMSANRMGIERLSELIASIGAHRWVQAQQQVNDYGRKLAEYSFTNIPDGQYSFCDVMDDDGFGSKDIKICVCVRVDGAHIEVDFAGTSQPVKGNINCPKPVTASAVYYVLRCLLPEYAPTCQGIFSWVQLCIPDGCILNASDGHAVAAGNTETSQRIVDCLLGALAKAIPESAVAASQGTMNNIALGSPDGATPTWSYYETIAGGMGAGQGFEGHSAVHTHMTNTLNTPAEMLELRYPMRITRYQIRRQSGGSGRYRGGDGLIREFEFLLPTRVTLLTERRKHRPWGLAAGGDGASGANYINGQKLAAKVSLDAKSGDRLTIETPGGGGWGQC